MMRVHVACPSHHDIEVPLALEMGTYGPCACGWTIKLAALDGLLSVRVAQVLDASGRPIQRIYLSAPRPPAKEPEGD
jgi:hypothetical protein